ncbi:MAG: potassium/proton antiporter [Phycisphaerales bacterium]|nr:potassium/proton antiporter [Phycisphaerales bacterium]
MEHLFFEQLPFITLIVGVLLAVGAILGRLGRFIGLPAGLLFLVVGMLIGEDGIWGVEFDDFDLTYALGSTALGLILFHGGLSTPVATLKCAWKPALALATLGVIGVTVVTAFGLWITNPENTIAVCLLIGAILGSTDAAAVFDLLAGQKLKGRAKEIIEVESGLNDPMAFVLVFGFTAQVAYGTEPGMPLVWFLCEQMFLGAILGVVLGWIWLHILRKARVGPGLYPVLAIAAAITTLGITMQLGGSGLLAAYLAGMVIGNHSIPYRPTVDRIFATLAWASQITMFFILGLLVTPSLLIADHYELMIGGALLALWVAFVSRPLVVGTILLVFRVPWRENLLICWSGLRGAVPIILATVPVLAMSTGNDAMDPNLVRIYGVVFMAVVVGSIVPGFLVRPVTRWLAMNAGRVMEPEVELDIVSGGTLEHINKTFFVSSGSVADGRTIKEIGFSHGVTVVMVLRNGELHTPHGTLRVLAGDHVMLVYKPKFALEVEHSFIKRAEA